MLPRSLRTWLWKRTPYELEPAQIVLNAVRSGDEAQTKSVRQQLFCAAVRLCSFRRPTAAALLMENVAAALESQGRECKEERGLLSLIRFQQSAEKTAAPEWTLIGRPHVIDLPIWGSWHIERANRRYLASLLASGNIPTLSSFGTVIIVIHCRANEKAQIAGLSSIRKLQQWANIEFCTWPAEIERLLEPSDLFPSSYLGRFVIAATRYSTLLKAKKCKADFSPGCADIICSNDFFRNCKQLILSGKAAVSDICVRTVDTKLPSSLAPNEDGVISVTAQNLYRAAWSAWHPHFMASFMRKTPNLTSVDPIQFNVTSENGFVMHAFQFFASAINHEKIPKYVGFDFHTPDGRLIADVLRPDHRDQDWAFNVEQPGGRFCMQVDSDAGESKFGVDFKVTPEDAVKCGLKWMSNPQDVEHFEWAAQKSVFYPQPTDAPTPAYPNDGLANEEIGTRLKAAFLAERTPALDSRNWYLGIGNDFDCLLGGAPLWKEWFYAAKKLEQAWRSGDLKFRIGSRAFGFVRSRILRSLPGRK